MTSAIRRFNAAAHSYDSASDLQRMAADELIRFADEMLDFPRDILDVGCGTGLVSRAAQARYPAARLFGLDAAPDMLAEAARQMPGLGLYLGDAVSITMARKFDAIFSSMLLHWLPEPLTAIKRWRGWLKPRGRLFVAVPLQGSFSEWRKLCYTQNVADGLWAFPSAGFADAAACRSETKTFHLTYASATAFAKTLKRTGAHTPHTGHMPTPTPTMRHLLVNAPRPMDVSVQVAFLEFPALDP